MKPLRGALLLACMLAPVSHAGAVDNGQWGDVPEHIRSWFKSVRAKNGVPCCSIADGHRTTWRGDAEGFYWVPIEGEWVKVPPEAVIYDAGNPFDEAVVFYSENRGAGDTHFIRCFVPGGGV